MARLSVINIDFVQHLHRRASEEELARGAIQVLVQLKGEPYSWQGLVVAMGTDWIEFHRQEYVDVMLIPLHSIQYIIRIPPQAQA